MSSRHGATSSPPIRAVVFDLGGVFFPWPQTDYFAAWAERLGIAPEMLPQLLWHGPDIEAANIGSITAEEYYRRSAKRLGADHAHVRLLIESAFAGEPLNVELAAYAARLRSRVRLAALTNTWSFGRRLIQQRGIAELFDLIVTSAEEGVKKPEARIYQVTLERLAIGPVEAIFIDDSTENVEAARALGIRSIQFNSTKQIIAALEELLRERDVVRA